MRKNKKSPVSQILIVFTYCFELRQIVQLNSSRVYTWQRRSVHGFGVILLATGVRYLGASKAQQHLSVISFLLFFACDHDHLNVPNPKVDPPPPFVLWFKLNDIVNISCAVL